MEITSANKIARRIVNLPRNIIGGVSRMMEEGIDLMGLGRRNQHQQQQYPTHSNFPIQNPQIRVQQEWEFLATFEPRYGTMHPFFYACRFTEALKIAQQEHKLVFMYLHSPDHPFTPAFCTDTVCSEVAVQFVDANFVSWAGLADRGEGLHMVTTLKPVSFPFCAVVAPVAGDSISVIQQIEGPVSPGELVEILQRSLEEHVSASGHARQNEELKSREDRRLREDQDAAYLASLQVDKKKGKAKVADSKAREPKPVKESQQKGTQIIQILIRFPNGEKKEHSFVSSDKIEAIYRYIDSLRIQGVGDYNLVSSFPRHVYGVDQMEMTLQDAAFFPKATIFLELLSP